MKTYVVVMNVDGDKFENYPVVKFHADSYTIESGNVLRFSKIVDDKYTNVASVNGNAWLSVELVQEDD